MKSLAHFFFPLVFFFFIVFSFVIPSRVQAQVACPSAEMNCSDLEAQGGCVDPCTRVITQRGESGTGPTSPSKCQCQSDEKKCKDEGGKWDKKKGLCTAKSASEAGLCATLDCPSNTVRKVLSRDSFTQLPLTCACYEILFQGQGTYIRVQECETNIVSKPGDYESDPVMASGIKTALGCIPYEPGPLVAWIFGLAVSIGGGIAFLIMGVGAFLFITSQGNPEQIQKAKEIMVSAGAGLLFIILSVFLLRLIGVDILRIPGFA